MITEKEISADGLRIFWPEPAAALFVTGADSFTFLQGQLTNDLRAATSTTPVYGLWLDHKGRVHGDGFVARAAPEAFWIFSGRTPADSLRTRLEGFIIADEVAIEDRTAEWGGVTVVARHGAALPEGLGLLALNRGAADPGESFVYPVAAAVAVREHWRGAADMTAVELERRRILAGVAAVPGDIGPGELPQEGGLERFAISYSKGCYLGQEVMARLKALGRARRQLVRVRGTGLPPPPSAPLYQGERRVGELKSVVTEDDGFIGLALLTLLHLQPDAALGVAPNQPGAIRVWR